MYAPHPKPGTSTAAAVNLKTCIHPLCWGLYEPHQKRHMHAHVHPILANVPQRSFSQRNAPHAESSSSTAAGASQAYSEPLQQPDSAGFDLLHKTKVDGGKKSAWRMTLETFGMADGGKRQKGDVLCATEAEAMTKIKEMVAGMTLDADMPKHSKWHFNLSPLEPLNATVDDLLRAFVLWSCKEDAPEFNVSKAFRRLDSYVTWMEDHRKDLEQPLTVDSVRSAAKAWNLKLTHGGEDRLVWWLDFGDIDVPSIKSTVSNSESLRYMVWLSHVSMLDKKAQENGLVMMQSMGHRGMIEMFTMLSMDLGTQMDRFTMGVVPLKMKSLYMFNHNLWLTVMMGMMKPFLSKKIRERFVTVPKNADLQAVLDEAVGSDCIPLGFASLPGAVERDIVFGEYVKDP